MKIYLGVTVDSELYQKIEKLRGLTKRSTFVEYLLKESIRGMFFLKEIEKIERN